MIFGDLRLDLKKIEARVKGEVVDLTIKEFEVLKYLALEPGFRIQIDYKGYEDVWKDESLL